MSDTLSPEYRAALAAHDAAQSRYFAAVAHYRARVIGDAEYLKARAAMDAANAAFDLAFAAESTMGNHLKQS